ncbi:VOC family protein [Chelatococcus asaccharovorans]|uniref:Methylmalonyl-CoA/ethylmalonyl-CoA epimerase n=1 Tax=Chelatococcus asaccharovorans TaxID=28210 RepID=A0A2V3UJ02_9HYPH|nr:VOC family protein [Chelatococcus asaccharovorans]MBS7706237.1 VOC family protein [Chelatococcus asaccharovorans]PXW65129.1 methylmalonyl-CoA/ethylmalonyl-CoA epimerase [Chelatococcus asaccharovorans]CAH1660515.1 Methylmalonyl-CoA/ethylmalonyl-CoA epimerase [Chelatococcus asaccharovorans]CAH1683775.1 Methylmalonyl-CoA/ethylmalonyl-CoA epimerase [Chelatococcus asaccharovorans]
MASGPFAHVCLLVNDLDSAIANWTKILQVLDPQQLERPIVRYESFGGGEDAGLRWACFVADHGTEIQLMQPAPGTPLFERLQQRGEHVHHLCFTTADVPGALDELEAKGIKLPTKQLFYDEEEKWQKWGWASARSAHGVLIEIASPYETHDDGRWYPAGSAKT